MKKIGFTLAEVLITLGIIGVVAALTAPALVSNTGNQANTSRLSVTVSNLEKALTTSMAEENSERLSAVSWYPEPGVLVGAGTHFANVVGHLGQHLNILGYSTESFGPNFYGSNNGPYFMSRNGEKSNDKPMQNLYFPIYLKNGAVLFFNDTYSASGEGDRDTISNAGGSLFWVVGNVIIDVNGKKGPNVLGRDIFRFVIGDDGILYPYGGYDYAVYLDAASPEQYFWKNSGAIPSYRCADENLNNGYGCTGRVIEEGYKINY